MTTAVGALNVVVRAGTAEFQSDMQRMAEIAKLKGNDIKSAMMTAADQGSSAFKSLANNISAINRPLDLISTGFNGLGASLGLGGATAGLTALMASAIGLASGMADLSIKTGVEVEQLSRFSTIAKLSGTDMDTVANVMKKLSINAVEAYSGNDRLARSFEAIGISTKDLKSASPDELMIKVAQGIKGIDPMVLQDLLATLGGRNASQALTFFKELNERLDETHAKISTQFAADAKEFDDNLTLMSNKLGGVSRDITGTFLPAINAMMEAMLKVNNGGFFSNLVGGAAAGIDAYFASATNFKEYAASIAQTELQIHDLQAKISAGKGNAYDPADLNTLKLRLQLLNDYKAKVETGLDNKTDSTKTAAAQSAIAANQSGTGGDNFLKGLQARIDKADQGEYAMLRLQAAQNGVLLSAAPLIEKLKALDEAKSAKAYTDGLDRQNSNLEFQNSLVGKSAIAQQILNNAHSNYLELQKQIEAIERTKGAISSETIQKMTEEMLKATTYQEQLLRQRDKATRSFEYGTTTALQKYLESAGNVASQSEHFFTHAFTSMEDALAQFVMTGKLNFSGFANSVMSDIARIYARMAITGLASYFAGSFGSNMVSGTPYTSNATGVTTPLPEALGDAFIGGRVTAFANGGIVNRPTLFPMADGMGLMGEAGAEAVMPLTRDSQGRLGVRSANGGGSAVQVNVVNQAGADGYQATTTQSQDANGKDVITVIVEKVKGAMNQDVRNNGPFSQLLANKYNLRGTM